MTSSRDNMNLRLLAAALAAAASLAACAGQGDIDRTQPDKVDKSIFYNADKSPKVFYYRQTFVDVPPTSNWAFEGTQGGMEKVRFEIQEKLLVGYRAYDYAPGSENAFTSTGNNDDTPILIFAITSQFDVKREYNPGTGEQTNVISENTTDRPWDQRQYMRVDWSQNLADASTSGATFDPMSEFMPVTDVKSSYYQETKASDPNFKYRPIMTADYIEFTQRTTKSPDYGACSLLYPFIDDAGPWNCGDAQINVRNSLMPVPKSSYQPLDYPDNYAVNDSKGNPVEVLPNGFPCTADEIAESGGTYSGDDCAQAQVGAFSKFGFFRTVVQSYDRNYGTTEANRQYYANRWNIWADVDTSGKSVWDANGNLRTLSLNDRVPKPIVYYTNVEFPDVDTDPQLTILNEAKEVAGDWSGAFTKTIAGMLLTEGNQTGVVTPAQLESKASGLTGTDGKPLQMVVLLQNSCNLTTVKAFLDAHADVAATVQSATGLASKDVDKAHIEQVCSIMEAETQTATGADKFTWQRNGDLRYSFMHWVDRPAPAGPLGYGPSSADPQTGEIISASAYLYGAALDTYAQFAVDSLDLLNGSISTDDLLSGKTILDVLKQTAATSASRNAQIVTPAALAKAKALVTSGGITPSGTPRLIPVPSGQPASKIAMIKGTQVESMLMTQDILAAMLPETKPGDTLTPDQTAQASPVSWATPEATDARRARFQTFAQNGCVYLGEFADDAILGLALELNKAGLTGDALFKEVRRRIFRGLTDHEMGHTMGLRHNFSGSSDALNYNDQYWKLRTMYPDDTSAADLQSRSANKIEEYQYSTVMDYGARFNADINGLGKYDYAAIRFGYGQLVDVMPTGAQTAGATGSALSNFITLMDYKKLPATVGSVDNLQDGGVQRYQAVRDQAAQWYAQGNNVKNGGFPLSPERPFKFCSDEYIGNLDCKAWDFGANQQEIISDTIDRYKNYFVFNAFKRGRLNWSIDGYFTRLLDRYFARFTEAYQFYYFYGGLDPSLDLPGDLLKASVDSINALGEILQTPEPGEHCPTKAQPGLYVLPDPSGTGENTCITGQPAMNIGVPDGKPYFINFSNDYYYRITRAGSLYEKLAALEALTNTEARFYRIDTFADSSKYAINYYSTFKPEMLNLLSGVIRMDSSTYGGQVVGGQYQPTPVVDLTTWGQAAPTTPSYLLPGAKRVDTPVNKTIQYYALLFSLGELDSSWDSTLDISNYMAVTIKGSKEDVTYNVPTVEYQHPQSGTTYRAPVMDPTQPGLGVGEKVINELIAYTGVVGTPGTLPEKFGTFKDKPLPDWQTAKANLDAAQGAATANTDATMKAALQQNYQDALTVFQAVDYQIAYRVDVLDDLRLFRNVFNP